MHRTPRRAFSLPERAGQDQRPPCLPVIVMRHGGLVAEMGRERPEAPALAVELGLRGAANQEIAIAVSASAEAIIKGIGHCQRLVVGKTHDHESAATLPVGAFHGVVRCGLLLRGDPLIRAETRANIPSFFLGGADLHEGRDAACGVDQRVERIGEVAIETLAAMVVRGEKGIPALASQTMIPGRWVAGTD